jgi:hypothetical protein
MANTGYIGEIKFLICLHWQLKEFTNGNFADNYLSMDIQIFFDCYREFTL